MSPIPEVRNVPLNVNEAKALLSLIDLAVKSGGLNAAEAGVILAKKINAAFEPQKETDVVQQLPE